VLPSWLTFTSSTRTFSGTPAAADVGTLSLKVIASDGADTVSDTFSLVISAAAVVTPPQVDTTIAKITWEGYSHTTSYAAVLGLKRSQLRKEVQRYFGFTSTYASLNTSQRCWVDSAITRGLRQFYYPEPLMNENYSHSWSFLMPTVVMQTEANADRYTLPLDFGGIEGDLQYVTTTNPGLRSTPIRVTSNHEIDEAVRRDSYLGQDYPSLASIQPRSLEPSATYSTRFLLRLYPVPTAVYTISMRYNALGYDVTDSADSDLDQYLPGSAIHAETILASCLDIAEQLADSRNRNDRMRGNFLNRLKASVGADRRMTTPETVGRMTDPSNYRVDYRRRDYLGGITYGGSS